MDFKIAGFTFNLFNSILFLVLGMLIGVHTLCSCSTVSIKEGLQMLADAAPVDDKMTMNHGKESWTAKALQYAGNMGYNTILQKHENYKGTKVPLEGTMLYFKDNEFKPECCPSTYSTGDGCACTSVPQIEYLNERGGNRTFSSNF